MKIASCVAFAYSWRRASSRSPPVMKPIGYAITLPFPNSLSILGVGGLAYDGDEEVWTVCADYSVGSSVGEAYPEAALPRLFHMKLDFESSSVDFVGNGAVFVSPPEGLKVEDIAFVSAGTATLGQEDTLSRDTWLVSEANSNLVKTHAFLSKDYGPPDLNSFDPETFATSRLLRVDSATGTVLEEASVPAFAQWNREYNWDSNNCVGDRPFQGFHALSIASSPDPAYDHLMFVGSQAALFQDGTSPTEFEGSATRVLVYGLKTTLASNTTTTDVDRFKPTAEYVKSFRYDTSHLTMKSFQKGARHFNAMFGILALADDRFLVLECEDLTGFGTAGQKIINRIFYVVLDDANSVDHCHSLLDCSVGPPTKRLVWERRDTLQLGGIAFGPALEDGTPTIALAFENDDKVGLHVELFALDMAELENTELWDPVDNNEDLRERRITAFIVGVVLFAFVGLALFVFIRSLDVAASRRKTSDAISKSEHGKTSSEDQLNHDSVSGKSRKTSRGEWLARYAMFSAMMNSFLVGGLTFGFSGMVLMLRKEGVYAESCACGSFCSKQKEHLAFISTAGFAAAIGSRLFIGLFMDKQGPKMTAILSSFLCILGFVILASSEDLTDTFIAAWVLLSIGGSGLHLSGFHFTNLFKGDGKKKASTGISAAFGASSAIFPLMQLFNQNAGVKLQDLAIVYTVVVCLVAINNLLIQPWNKIVPGVPYDPNIHFYRRDFWQRNLKSKPLLTSVLEEAKKFDFYGEAVFFSVSILLLTHYLSTTSQLMYEKGDVPFTNNTNDWSDYIITRMAGWFNALGFIWFPLVTFIIVRFKWSQCYIILAIVNMAVVAIVFAKTLEVHIIGFTLLSFSRLMLFSCHHTYLLDTFGIEFFGTLNGISSLLAAIIGYISYPLQLFGLSTNYAYSFIPIGVLVLLSIAFPIILHRRLVLNWAETFAVDPNTIRYPKNIKEVKELIRSNDKIRCAGAMHSCAPLIASDGIIMSLTKFEQILEIDPVKGTVRCEAGVRMHNLCEALVPYELAVGTLGTIDWQTISGAVMTGTHGGALSIPSLHAFVTSYTLVKPDTTVITVSKESDPKLFSAMAPSMGVFGVVVEMELQCVPLEILEARLEIVSFDDLVSTSKFEDVMEKNKYARVVIYPSINKATVWSANPVPSIKDAVAKGAIDRSGGYINFRDEHEKAWLEQYIILFKKRKYDEADRVLHKVLASQGSRLSHYVGQYNHVLCKERNNGIPHADIEFNFDYIKSREVLRTVKKYCDSHRVPYYNFEIRTTKQDNAMLSCCQGRDAMWIDFQAKADVSVDFFGAIEEVLKPIGFRKHWAKGLQNTDPSYVVNQFPMIREFVELVRSFDPMGKFLNQQGVMWYSEITDILQERKEKKDVRVCVEAIPVPI